MVLSSSRALLGIINDILDLSKIESGLMTLDVHEFDMDSLVDDVAARVEGVAAQKNLKIRREVAPARRGTFRGDAQRIAQVLVNLLGNAIKFTEKGEVLLLVGPTAGQGTRFAVRDTGPGIPPDQLRVVFERFRQLDGSATRKHAGTGLGLAISKELIELMKGRIGVDSTLGVGSTFWFELPLEFSAADKAGRGTPAERRVDRDSVQGGLKVLLAEDNQMNQEVIVEALSLQGMKTTVAENGRVALELLQRETFDLVLMDIHMPEMNGDVAIEKIRHSGASYAGVPIIVVTASAMKGMDDRYLKLGADAFVPKPVELPVLQEAIARVLKRTAARAVA
jgi:CheY-like chemotaxis protein